MAVSSYMRSTKSDGGHLLLYSTGLGSMSVLARVLFRVCYRTYSSRSSRTVVHPKATWLREGIVARVLNLRIQEKLRHATMKSLDVSGPV